MSNLAVVNDFIEKRSEIINGREYLMAAPKPNHAIITGNISNYFFNYLDGKECLSFASDVDVHLSENDTFRPDVSVVCDESKIKSDAVYLAPDLVVEVLSPSNSHRDRGIKKNAYEKFGVKEYWIVDPVNKSVEIYGLLNGRYELHSCPRLFSDDDLKTMSEEEKAVTVITSFSPIIFPEMVINVRDVFKRIK